MNLQSRYDLESARVAVGAEAGKIERFRGEAA